MNDVTNSRSSTPRTDENAIESLVHIDFARTLELELYDAITRIAAAEDNAKCAWQTAANSDKAYQAEYAKRKEAEAKLTEIYAREPVAYRWQWDAGLEWHYNDYEMQRGRETYCTQRLIIQPTPKD
jgi:hypothetical protein